MAVHEFIVSKVDNQEDWEYILGVFMFGGSSKKARIHTQAMSLVFLAICLVPGSIVDLF